jgi:hypothetical protein
LLLVIWKNNPLVDKFSSHKLRFVQCLVFIIDQHGIECFLIILLHNKHSLPYTNILKKKMKIFKLGVKHQRQHVMCFNFFSSYVLKNEKKESKTPNTNNLMLEPKVVNLKKNSNVIIHEGLNGRFQMHFIPFFKTHCQMVKFKAFNNNQCLANWFKTQPETTRFEQSTIVWQMNHVIKRTKPAIRTLVCML